MKAILLVFCLITSFNITVFADNPIRKLGHKLDAESFQVSVFTNQYYFPFKGIGNVVGSKYHPGLSLGYGHVFKEKKNTTLCGDFKLGVYHHRFIQTGIQLYGNVGYRFKLPYSFFATLEYGLGYLHSIKQHKSFKLNSDGEYEKVPNYGRPQVMTGLGIKLGRKFIGSKFNSRIYLNYQPWFQFPFIKSYVPLLPNNSVHLGIDFIIK